MQILAMAKLARTALDSEAEDTLVNAGFALDAIMWIARAADAEFDAALIAISAARLAAAAHEVAESSFGRVEPPLGALESFLLAAWRALSSKPSELAVSIVAPVASTLRKPDSGRAFAFQSFRSL